MVFFFSFCVFFSSDVDICIWFTRFGARRIWMTAISSLPSEFPPNCFDKYYFRLNCILVKYPAPFRAARGFFLDSAGGIFFFFFEFFF